MILTVTPNTALDLTYHVPSLTPRASHRVREVVERPGGKGLNVARVLAALGHPVTVTGLVGGGTGRAVRERLAQVPGLTDALVPVAGATRRTVTVLDAATGEATRLAEPGPLITPAEWAAFTEAYEELLPSCSALALCGGLPPGVPVNAYAQLVRAARAASVPVLLDTAGEPLRRAIAARPDVLTATTEALAELTGAHDPAEAVRDARRRGAHAVVAALGPGDGLHALTPDGDWRAAPPEPVQSNPSAAGDAAVAGLLSGAAAGLAWPERLARAVALSSAAQLAPELGELDLAAYEELRERVRVTGAAGDAEREGGGGRTGA